MRAVNGTIHKKRRNKVLKEAKGFRGGRKRLYRTAKNAVMKAGLWSYRDRRQKKRFFRRLWITRINIACRAEGISYSKFMHLLKKNNVDLNRKSLSELAIADPQFIKKILASTK